MRIYEENRELWRLGQACLQQCTQRWPPERIERALAELRQAISQLRGAREHYVVLPALWQPPDDPRFVLGRPGPLRPDPFGAPFSCREFWRGLTAAPLGPKVMLFVDFEEALEFAVALGEARRQLGDECRVTLSSQAELTRQLAEYCNDLPLGTRLSWMELICRLQGWLAGSLRPVDRLRTSLESLLHDGALSETDRGEFLITGKAEA